MRQPVPFGKYLLLERISVGGMAEVFKARPLSGNGSTRLVAIKRILPAIAEDVDFIQMFVDEAKITGQLNHPNIAQLYELGRVDDAHFIAMEFVWGKDLLQVQNRFRRLKQSMKPAMAAFVARCICMGLDHAHRKTDASGSLLGIIHRDVSPQNILISYNGDVKVIDFGIAKAASRATKTQAGIIKGKFGYMSPEQVRGLPLDRRSDVFAIGTILYEMLTTERLFVGESDFATLEKVRNVDVPPPSAVNPACPAALEAIILRALARNVDDRYQWASDMLVDLQAYQQAAPFTAAQLAGWMREQFAGDVERDRSRFQEHRKIDPTEFLGTSTGASIVLVRGLDVPATSKSVAQPAGGRPVGATVTLGLDDIELDELPLATDPRGELADATQVSSPEFKEILGAAEGGGRATGGEISGAAIAIDEIIEVTPAELALIERVEAVSPRPTMVDTQLPAHTPAAVPPPRRERTRSSGPVPIIAAERTTRPSGQAPIVASTRPSLARDLLVGIAVAAVLVVGVLGVRTYLLPSRVLGTLVVTVSPAVKATLVLDGIERGQIDPGAVLTVKNLRVGPHRLLLRGESGSFDETVNVPAGNPAVVAATLRGAESAVGGGKSGVLKILLKERGAQIFIDGAQTLVVGDSPIVLEAGVPHELRIALSGHEDVRETLLLKPGETIVRAPALQPAKGHLRVETVPPGAEVRVDGKSIGRSPVTVGGLDAKRAVSIDVQKSGYLPVKRMVDFVAGAQQKVELVLVAVTFGAAKVQADSSPKRTRRKVDDELPRLIVPADDAPAAGSSQELGHLIALTQPWARVLVDGKDTGKTTPIAGRAKLPLSPGFHIITFETDGKSYDFAINIKPGQDYRLERQLVDAP